MRLTKEQERELAVLRARIQIDPLFFVKEALGGEPWEKDTTPVKARHTEKWIYSCETGKGLTYDCVFLYFMGNRVINVGTFYDTPDEL